MITHNTVNSVTILGWLGNAPELRHTPKNAAVTTFRVATKRVVGTGEESRQETDWHSIEVWGKQAESCVESLRKGSRVLVEGHLETDMWKDEAQQTHSRTKIVADKIVYLDKRVEPEAVKADG